MIVMQYHACFVIFEKKRRTLICRLLQIIGGALWVLRKVYIVAAVLYASKGFGHGQIQKGAGVWTEPPGKFQVALGDHGFNCFSREFHKQGHQ